MKIIVAGGGTAGWLTALYAKKIFDKEDVTVIQSSEIGILGAGEGATPQLVELLDFLDIKITDLFKECSSTIKNGIKFSNWSKNKSFYHPFGPTHYSSFNNYKKYKNYRDREVDYCHISAAKFDINQSDYSMIHKISEGKMIPSYNGELLYNWSIHFNARLFAKYLEEVGVSRGIKIVDDEIESSIVDNYGNIKKILLKRNKPVECDFIFDCTGFNRFFIGKTFKETWIAHKLPMKKAIPFFMDIDKDIPPYTESIKMDYGWVWKIPVQDRYGMGYVFDSDYATEEMIEKEISRKFIKDFKLSRTIDFNAGYYKNVWIKNCLAIGLSSSFIEPLEATSIWQVCNALKRIFVDNNISSYTELDIEKYNNEFSKEITEVSDFIYLHYLIKNKDTAFWENFEKDNPKPDFINEVLEIIDSRPLTNNDFLNKKMFHMQSYNHILIGNEILTKDKLKKYSSLVHEDIHNEFLDIIKIQKEIVNLCTTHIDFIEWAKNEKN